MKDTKKFTLTAMFLAIMILLASTPLGFIPIPPLNPTTMHIPVIIGSIILGPRLGAFLGGVFGIISCIRATIIVSPLSFVFSPLVPVFGSDTGSPKALIIAIVPRILIGVVPYFVYQGLKKLTKNRGWKHRGQYVSFAIAGIAGSLTNTILVMNLIYFLFQPEYAAIVDASGTAIYAAVLTTIFSSGVPEAIVAGFITAPVCAVLLKTVAKQRPINL